MDKYVTVFADASWCPDTHVYGWALWVKYGDGETRRAQGGGYGMTGSHLAERKALRNAIAALAYYGIDVAGKVVVIQSDCQTELENADVQALYKAGAEHVRLKHVKAHRGHACARSSVNTWCDRAARKQMRQRRKILQGKTVPQGGATTC